MCSGAGKLDKDGGGRSEMAIERMGGKDRKSRQAERFRVFSGPPFSSLWT